MSLTDFFVDLGAPSWGSYVGAPLARFLSPLASFGTGLWPSPLNEGEMTMDELMEAELLPGNTPSPRVAKDVPFAQWLQRQMLTGDRLLEPKLLPGFDVHVPRRGIARLSMPLAADRAPVVDQVRRVVGPQAEVIEDAEAKVPSPPLALPAVGVSPVVRPKPVPVDYRIKMAVQVRPRGITVDFSRAWVGNAPNPKPQKKESKNRSKALRGFGRFANDVLQGALDAAGTMSEVQDLFEAFAWAAKDRYGRSAMMLERGGAFRSGEGHGLYKGWATNWRQYAGVAEGIASGRYEVDLSDALQSYASSQALDVLAGVGSRARQALANSLGYDMPVGVEALEGLHKRSLGLLD